MRSESDLGPDPWSAPATYPGERPASDYLLLGDEVRPLRVDATGWRTPGGPAGELRPVALHERSAVVAFGSNAAPAQLIAKFGPVPTGIPVTRARLHGFALAHSAHVSVPGYLPWVLVDVPGSAVDCAVLWLDDAQRVRLDVTEPNYRLVPVDPNRHPLVFHHPDAVHRTVGVSAYRGRWGALRWPGGTGPAGAGSQAAVFARLSTLAWFRELVGPTGAPAARDLEHQQRTLAADADLRDRLRQEFVARGMTVPDGWAEPDAG